MEESDEETVQLGRKYTIGKECYPCILTTGDMLKTVQKEGFEPAASAFFMPSARAHVGLGSTIVCTGWFSTNGDTRMYRSTLPTRMKSFTRN